MARTIPLYYQDAYRSEFTARVIESKATDQGYQVILDRTCFYPEGGGQPADHGWLAGAPVLHVSRREDGAILHRTEGDPGSGDIEGSVNWPRRYEYMQQHTGQHILSGALYREGLQTVSVHQGSEFTTIEVEGPPVTDELLRRVEEGANSVVRRNLAVRDFEVPEDEIDRYQLRRPPKVSGRIRLVEIDGWDLVACGGVHTATAGEVGLLKAVRVEKIRGNSRIYFKIGERAYADYSLKTEITNRLMDELSAQPPEIPERVRKLVEEGKESEYRRRQIEDAYASLYLSSRLDSRAGEFPILIDTLPREAEPTLLQKIAQEASNREALGLLLFLPDTSGYRWAIVVKGTSRFPQAALKEELLPAMGAKGGGKPPLWQGKAEHPDAPERGAELFAGILEAAR